MNENQLVVIKFSDWIKTLVEGKVHTGVCQCQRMFGTKHELVFEGGINNRVRLLDPKVHCPQCGSGWIMAHKGAGTLVKVSEGELEYFISSGGRVCRKCGNIFHEYEVFTSCKADPPKQLLKHQEKVEKANKAAESLGFTGGIDAFREQLLKLREEREKTKG